MDLRGPVSERLVVDIEHDEFQHKDRETSCEHAKLAGHMMDCGAAGYTKQEAALWDEALPTDKQLDALKDTHQDTPANERLRVQRRRATQRVIRDYNVKVRAARAKGGSSAPVCLAPKLHVIRFNCDSYVTDKGVRVGSLFYAPNLQDEKAVLSLKPTKLFQPAVEAVANRLVELVELERDDEWFESRREMEVEYIRYDGCVQV
jgi:hypothetical protein